MADPVQRSRRALGGTTTITSIANKSLVIAKITRGLSKEVRQHVVDLSTSYLTLRWAVTASLNKKQNKDCYLYSEFWAYFFNIWKRFYIWRNFFNESFNVICFKMFLLCFVLGDCCVTCFNAFLASVALPKNVEWYCLALAYDSFEFCQNLLIRKKKKLSNITVKNIKFKEIEF